MKGSKLSALHINIIGGVVALVMVLIMYFAMIKPKSNDTDIQVAAVNTAVQAGGTQDAVDKATRDLAADKKKTAQIKKDWAIYDVKYMPDIKWDSNILRAYYTSNQINEIPATWGRWITNWYDSQTKFGVHRDPSVVFPVPPLAASPNEIANLTSITFPSAKDPWKVTMICQTFDDAMAHLRRFNGIEHHGMPVVNHVTLSGHSPTLTMTYDLSLYIIPRTPPPAADARIGGAVGGGGGGGMGGMGGMGGSKMPMMSGGISAAGTAGK
jgi:hypothetical protein